MSANTAKKETGVNYIGPVDSNLDRQAREKIVTARIGMLLRAPFFGNLATRLKLVNSDEWLQTAATDGRSFYFNSRFIMALATKEVEFLVGHELLHVAYDHMDRRGSRHAQLYNIACDYAVNADLVKHKVGTLITTVPALYDRKYDGMSSEEIYEILYENAEKIDISALSDMVLDEHLDGEEGDGEGAGDGDKDSKAGAGKPKLSAEERQQIRDEFRQAMIAAAQQADAGNVPGGVGRMLADLTEPKMNWRELLRMQLESTVRSDYSWMRPSKRGWHHDAIMPGMKPGETVDIVVAIDESGSISDAMTREFLSEVQGIMDQFDAYKIHVLTFDTQVYNPVIYTSENLESIAEYEVMGGGGTDFDCVFEFLKEEQIEPKRLVWLTDGYPCGSWGDENYCDNLWIIHGSKTIVAPFGTTTYYED
jgi:predicted metal-dependent peptidase